MRTEELDSVPFNLTSLFGAFHPKSILSISISLPIPTLRLYFVLTWVIEPVKECISKIRGKKINGKKIPIRPVRYFIFQFAGKNYTICLSTYVLFIDTVFILCIRHKWLTEKQTALLLYKGEGGGPSYVKVFCRDSEAPSALYWVYKSSVTLPPNLYHHCFHPITLPTKQYVYDYFNIFCQENVYTLDKAASILLQWY